MAYIASWTLGPEGFTLDVVRHGSREPWAHEPSVFDLPFDVRDALDRWLNPDRYKVEDD